MNTPAGILVALCDLTPSEYVAYANAYRLQRGPMVACENHQRGSLSIVRSVTDASAAARRALSPYGTEHGSPTGVI